MVVQADSVSYVDTSKSLFETGRFLSKNGNIEIRRTPGYPIIIAATYHLFGPGDLLPTIIVQNIAFFLTVLVSAYLAYQLAGTSGMIIASLLLVLDFTTFYFVNVIHTETLFTLFITSTILFLLIGWRSPNRILMWWLIASTSFSIATIIRPSSLYLFYAAALLAVIYFTNHQRSPIAGFKMAVAIFLPWIVIIGSWQLRNYLLVGPFVLTSIEGELFHTRTVSMLAILRGVEPHVAALQLPEHLKFGSSPIAHIQFYLKNFGIYIKASLLSIGRTLFSPAQEQLQDYFTNIYRDLFALETPLLTGEFGLIIEALKQRPIAYLPLILLVLLHSVLIATGVIVSAFFARSIERRSIIIYAVALLFIVYFLFIVTVFVGHPRFHVPFAPLLAILSGYGYSQLIKKFKKPSPA